MDASKSRCLFCGFDSANPTAQAGFGLGDVASGDRGLNQRAADLPAVGELTPRAGGKIQEGPEDGARSCSNGPFLLACSAVAAYFFAKWIFGVLPPGRYCALLVVLSVVTVAIATFAILAKVMSLVTGQPLVSQPTASGGGITQDMAGPATADAGSIFQRGDIVIASTDGTPISAQHRRLFEEAVAAVKVQLPADLKLEMSSLEEILNRKPDFEAPPRAYFGDWLRKLGQETGLDYAFPLPLADSFLFRPMRWPSTTREIVEEMAREGGLQTEYRDGKVIFWKDLETGRWEGIVKKLADPLPGKRLEAVHFMAYLSDRRVCAELFRALRDPEIAVWTEALRGLRLHLLTIRYSQDLDGGVASLLRLLETGANKDLRPDLIQLLGMTGHPHAVSVLQGYSKDADQIVRQHARSAVARMGDPSSLDAALSALATAADPWEKKEALANLGFTLEIRSLRVLAANLSEPGSWPVHCGAKEGLQLLLHRLSVDSLLQVFSCANYDLQMIIIPILAWTGDPRAIATLRKIAASATYGLRPRALIGLAENQDPEAVNALLGNLVRDPDPELRGCAAYALRRIRDPRASLVLSAMLRDSHPEVRVRAQQADSYIRSPIQPRLDFLRFIEKLLFEPDPGKRKPVPMARSPLPLLSEIGERALHRALEDPCEEVRAAAARLIGEEYVKNLRRLRERDGHQERRARQGVPEIFSFGSRLDDGTVQIRNEQLGHVFTLNYRPPTRYASGPGWVMESIYQCPTAEFFGKLCLNLSTIFHLVEPMNERLETCLKEYSTERPSERYGSKEYSTQWVSTKFACQLKTRDWIEFEFEGFALQDCSYFESDGVTPIPKSRVQGVLATHFGWNA